MTCHWLNLCQISWYNSLAEVSLQCIGTSICNLDRHVRYSDHDFQNVQYIYAKCILVISDMFVQLVFEMSLDIYWKIRVVYCYNNLQYSRHLFMSDAQILSKVLSNV